MGASYARRADQRYDRTNTLTLRVVGYDVEAHVARGGMGDIYRARVEATGERVALKVMREAASFDDDRAARERFLRESRVLAGLDHPNVVRYIAHGTTVDGRPFLASEWLDGPTLSERLSRGRLSVHEAVKLGFGIAAALRAAHEAGVTHRDVKPSNIVLMTPPSRSGAAPGETIPVLIDFGVAKLD